MTIDWIHFTPWRSLAGGVLLGIATAAFVLLNGRLLGISGIASGVLRPRPGDAGWRVELDERNEKLGYKIREAQLAKIPYAVVIGDKEVAAATVAPRRRGGENLAPMALDGFMERLRLEVAQERGEA